MAAVVTCHDLFNLPCHSRAKRFSTERSSSSSFSDPPRPSITAAFSLTVPSLVNLTGDRQDNRTGAQEMSALRLYQLDPTLDPRWEELLERNPSASVFHPSEWLRA